MVEHTGAYMDTYTLRCGDAIEFANSLADDSIDLVFTSVFYEDARTYGIGIKLKGEDWVKWMVKFVQALAPKCKGLIAINCEGRTKKFKYSGVPFLLYADLHRAGFNMRKPMAFSRSGIPGGGGPDWMRNDWEPIICITRPGKLPWSDNTACGHPPLYAPGGAMSNRNEDGVRKNSRDKPESREARRNQWGGTKSNGNHRKSSGEGTELFERPSHKFGEEIEGDDIANPGNVLKFKVGGGVMGHKMAHESEAPFPLGLAEFFVKSFCPPRGVVCDPMCGSGTVGHAALLHDRHFIGCDLRESQIKLTRRRLKDVFGMFLESVDNPLALQPA